MNGHPRAALDPRIEPPESPMNWPNIYGGFKPIKYNLQSRLVSKSVPQQTCLFYNLFWLESFFLIPGGPRGSNIFSYSPNMLLATLGFLPSLKNSSGSAPTGARTLSTTFYHWMTAG